MKALTKEDRKIEREEEKRATEKRQFRNNYDFMERLVNKHISTNFKGFIQSGIFSESSDDINYMSDKWVIFLSNPVNFYGRLDSDHRARFINWINS